MRAAAQLGNYCAFFRLYSDAPGHASYVIDTFVDHARLEALKVFLKAYAPSVPASYLAKNLGFDSDEEAVFFVEDHGGALIEPERTAVDCKASRAGFVEHSIAQKLEEERKEAQRKAEIVPISFS